MTARFFDGIWAFGQTLYAYDADSANGREFKGFIEALGSGYVRPETRGRAGVVPEEKFRLIAELSETFSRGIGTEIVGGSVKYELLSVKEIYDGEKVSHRECVLLKTGEAESDA